MKQCCVCNEVKDRSEFYKATASKDGLMFYCKLCSAAKSREWRNRAGNRELHNQYQKFYAIRKKYGLEKEQYMKMIAKGCEVCGSSDGLAVDHDHGCCPGQDTCGKCIRGLLCKRHNWAAGNLRDSADEARKLADYLDRTRSNVV